MRIYGYSEAKLVETESYYVYYQNYLLAYPTITGNNTSTDEEVLELIKKLNDEITLKYLQFFNDKVLIITYKEPFWFV